MSSLAAKPKDQEVYVNIKIEDLVHWNIYTGARGLGKTFSVLKNVTPRYFNSEKQFIFLRDNEKVVKKLATANSLFTGIEAKNPDFPHIDLIHRDDNYMFVINKGQDDERVIGYLMALSTFSNARGINYDNVNLIIFDEFIPEEGKRSALKDPGTVFLNMYETVNRNREIETFEHAAEDPVQLILLSNSNDIYSSILESLGLSYIIENMIQNGENYYNNGEVRIEFMANEVFYEKKKQTMLYRYANNQKFTNMALENKFNNSMALIRPKMDLKGCKGILNLDNKYVLVQLANGSLYWKTGTFKKIQNYDMNNDQEAMLFRYAFSDRFRRYYIVGKMYFDSIYTQRSILNYAKIN